ncbi:PKD domain-containing protein [Chloroflexota bacterium]
MNTTIRKSFSILTAALIIFSLFTIIAETKPRTAAADTPASYFESPPGSDWGLLYTDDATENATAFSAAEVTGGYVFTGTQTGPVGEGLDWWGVVGKIDSSGTLTGDVTFDTDLDHNAGYDIIGVADGYVVAGTKHQTDGSNYDPHIWLMKTNTSLVRQWEQTYGNAYPDYGNSVAPDGTGFILGGFQGDGGSGSGWIINTDASGIQQWEAIAPTDAWLIKEVYSAKKALDGGYILGTADGIRKSATTGTPPANSWTSATGNPYYSVQQTADLGYIGVGTTTGGDGTYDIILTKLNSSGVVQWSTTYKSDALVPEIDLDPGELPHDYGRHVVQTSDGGYAIVGETDTITHGGTTYYGNGGNDLWILKVNSTGVLQWDLALGGDGDDSGQHIVETSDNDLLVSGSATVGGGAKQMWILKVNGTFVPPTPAFTYTPDSPVFVGQQVDFDGSTSSDNTGITDYAWDFGDDNGGSGVTTNHTYRSPGTYTVTLAVTDDDGATRSTHHDVIVAELGMVWESVIDGSDSNGGMAIVAAHDGGYIIAGYTENGAYGGTSTDGWLIKINDDGSTAWEKKYADYSNIPSNIQAFEAIAQTTDGGYIVTGKTQLSTHTDLWLIKTDVNGTPSWYKTFGGAYNDEGLGVAQTMDGGYIVTGFKSSALAYDSRDVWLMKTDGTGTLAWEQTFSDASYAYSGNAVIQTFDGGYAIATAGSGNKTDIDLIKTNSSGAEQWTTTWDGSSSYAGGRWVAETADRSGIVVAGCLDGSVSLAKVNNSGAKQWNKEHDMGEFASGYDAAKTPDGGYIIVGLTLPVKDDCYLVKTDASGVKEWEKKFGTTAEYEEGSGIIALADGSYIAMYNRSTTGDTDMLIRKYGNTGVFATDSSVTIDEWSVTEDPGADPTTYDPAGAPGGADLDNSRGFEITASGPDGTYAFRINFTTAIDDDFVLYKLPGWTVVPYTVIDEYTIEISLDITGGVLDPPFMLVPDTKPNTPTHVEPASGATMISVTPTLRSSAYSHIDAGDTHAASQWQVRADSGTYSSPVYDSFRDMSNKVSIIVPASLLDGNSTYYWRVRHQDNKGNWSDWSTETWFLTINTAPNQPTNTAPANGASGVSLTPTLTSSAFADTDASDTHNASQWQITTTAGNYDTTVYDSGTDVTNKISIAVPASTLTVNTTYYWRMRHRDNGIDWSAWSTETSFTTLNNAPNQPSNALPSDEATGVSVTPTLSSSAFADSDTADTHAASQWLITTTAGSYGSPLYDSGTDATNKISIAVPASTLDTNTTYYFKVRHQDNHGTWSAWSFETSFTTLNTAPGQPTNSTPANAATSVSLTPTLSSSAFADADAGDTHAASQWHITTTSGSYGSVVFDSGADTSNKTSIAIPAATLSYSTTYYWRVQYQDSHGTWSAWSAETSFTTMSEPITNVAPSTPVNVTPADIATGVSATPTLESSAFSDSNSGDTHAASQWQVTTTSGNYSSPVYDSSTDTSNKTSIAIPSSTLSKNTVYYWRVRHKDSYGNWSDWSIETSFTTAGGGGCGASAAAASATDIASGWGVLGLLGVSGAYTGWRQKKRKK